MTRDPNGYVIDLTAKRPDHDQIVTEARALPTDEGAARGEKLPVLHLLHGSGDNDATWAEHGRASVILDNLITGTFTPGRRSPGIPDRPG
jgi:hypothetical protein